MDADMRMEIEKREKELAKTIRALRGKGNDPNKSPMRRNTPSNRMRELGASRKRIHQGGSSQIVDRIRVEIKGGDGGDGMAAFDRGPHKRIGPPSGGDAGAGGNVTLIAVEDARDLRGVGRRVQAGRGSGGAQSGCTGARGAPKVVRVPVGTLVWDQESEDSLLADLSNVGDKYLVARGGRGGRGNIGGATGQFRSGIGATYGEIGESKLLILELRLLADVGLAGLPNAGKSSILYSATRASPQVADYAFSTLRPSKGVAKFSDYSSISMVDLPGLISGASQGRGLGHSFLRHLQRAPVLCLVIDAANKPLEALSSLRKELETFDASLLSSHSLTVVANKMDVPESEQGLADIEAELHGSGIKVFPVCAHDQTGFEPLMLHLHETVMAKKAANSKN